MAKKELALVKFAGKSLAKNGLKPSLELGMMLIVISYREQG
jgi:hypothetical protein